jgi:D-alanyl-D-alanine carboxypeptidase/D-alanyl-D-alanine-endopeptidase (penicillin-binding protein 4)
MLTTLPADFISSVYAAVRSNRRGLLGAVVGLLAVGAPAQAAPLDGLVASHLARSGGGYGGFVLDTTTGRTLAAVNPDVARIPASVNKLYTSATALLTFGANARLATAVLGAGTLGEDGVWKGNLFLRGGGDPTLGSPGFVRRYYAQGATMAALAAAVRAAGVRRVAGGVYGDESWFDRLRGGPTTGFRLDPFELGPPLGALLYNRGHLSEYGGGLQARPAKFAARQLVAELRRRGVGADPTRVGERSTPAAAQELARVGSPTIATLVRWTLAPSDNFLAEMLLKAVGAQFGPGGSTAGGVRVVRRTLREIEIAPAIVDGSGLARSDRTTPRQVALLLNAMRDTPGFRGGLAVAGRTGTLEDRMRFSSAQDRCQGKTGTLSDVSALAGYCRTPNGHVLAFAFLENSVYTPSAKLQENRLLIQLARYRPDDTEQPPPADG